MFLSPFNTLTCNTFSTFVFSANKGNPKSKTKWRVIYMCENLRIKTLDGEKRITEIRFDFVISFLVSTKLKMNWAQNPFHWTMSLCNTHNPIFIRPPLSLSHTLSPSLPMPFIHTTKHAYKYMEWRKELNKSHRNSNNMNKFAWNASAFSNGLYEIMCWKSQKHHFNANVRLRFLILLHPKIDIFS